VEPDFGGVMLFNAAAITYRILRLLIGRSLAWIHRAGEEVDEFEAENSDSVVAF